MNSFFLRNIEFLGIVKEWVILRNNRDSNEGRGSSRGRTSCRLVAKMGVFVRMTSDFMTYEALIVMHVLYTLGRGESEDIYCTSMALGSR